MKGYKWILVKQSEVYGSWGDGNSCLVSSCWLRKLPFQYETEKAAKIALKKRGLDKDVEKPYVEPYQSYCHRLDMMVTIDRNIVRWVPVMVPDNPSW